MSCEKKPAGTPIALHLKPKSEADQPAPSRRHVCDGSCTRCARRRAISGGAK